MKRKKSPKALTARARKLRTELARAYTESAKEDRATVREWDATINSAVHI
jgi:hypothetical protein